MTSESLEESRLATLTWLQPGTSWRVVYSFGHPRNERRHIRAIVDGEQVVYRVWRGPGRGWVYKLDDWYGFWLLRRDGHLKPAPKIATAPGDEAEGGG